MSLIPNFVDMLKISMDGNTREYKEKFDSVKKGFNYMYVEDVETIMSSGQKWLPWIDQSRYKRLLLWFFEANKPVEGHTDRRSYENVVEYLQGLRKGVVPSSDVQAERGVPICLQGN